jgi:hypothetical protein
MTKVGADDRLPTDDRRPTTDDRRPTTDDRRPTTDDRRPTTDDRRLATGNRRPPSPFGDLSHIFSPWVPRRIWRGPVTFG